VIEHLDGLGDSVALIGAVSCVASAVNQGAIGIHRWVGIDADRMAMRQILEGLRAGS
jgi:hypothetical protein